MNNAYNNAGVDVEAGYEVVRRIQSHVARTQRLGATGNIGGFGGLFNLHQLNINNPVLVSGTDGVGTKLMLAKMAQKHDTIGIDCVAMCVNDIIAQGAQPLFFLDYIACGHNNPKILEQVVSGVADGCIQAQAALIGGETAEMPDMYEPDEYDLAGFAVGAVCKDDIVDGSHVHSGDILVGLHSSGLHSNGFSLVRKVFFKDHHYTIDSTIDDLAQPLGQELLIPTRIYVQALIPLLQKHYVHGVAHITGGGFIENIPRMLHNNLSARIDCSTWQIPPIFHILETLGNISHSEMFNIFNMGIGMVVAVPEKYLDETLQLLKQTHTDASVIGEIIEDERPVTLTNL